jgi:hypothetical protein
MPNNKALPPKPLWPTEWLESADDPAWDAAVVALGPYETLRHACLQIAEDSQKAWRHFFNAWGDDPDDSLLRLACALDDALHIAYRELALYCREHRDEIRFGTRQKAHALSIKWELHYRRTFHVRDRLSPEQLARVLAGCNTEGRTGLN